MKKLTTPPEQITRCLLEVIAMPNGEVICNGKTLGWVKTMGKYLFVPEIDITGGE